MIDHIFCFCSKSFGQFKTFIFDKFESSHLLAFNNGQIWVFLYLFLSIIIFKHTFSNIQWLILLYLITFIFFQVIFLNLVFSILLIMEIVIVAFSIKLLRHIFIFYDLIIIYLHLILINFLFLFFNLPIQLFNLWFHFIIDLSHLVLALFGLSLVQLL